jgi:carboxyl-terminal processing protease
MKKNIVLGIFFLYVMHFTGFSQRNENNFEIVKNLDIYGSLFKELNMYYVDPIDAGKIIKTGIDAMLKSLDPYTTYIPESEIEDYKFMTTGQYGGVGAFIQNRLDGVVIVSPYKNSPIDKAGLKAGDVILEIDGKSTIGKKGDEVSEALKGQPKTAVKLLIKRYGVDKPFEKEIIREKISDNSVQYFGMLDDKIGYIYLANFYDKSAKEVRNALMKLKDSLNIQGLVLDLRGNPGGLLIESVNIVNLFVEKEQLIVSTKGRVSEWNKDFFTTNLPADTTIPIVVLVDRGSASASEIVSGAIQDLDRGVIVGQRTYGKGLVQTSRPLEYNSQLKVTTAKYYIPSGRCIQALDYTHRNEDGSVGKVPDSLITEFKTKNLRKVYDGGGISPDIEVEAESLHEISLALVRNNLIFDYSTRFYFAHNSIENPKKFNISDEIYSDFVKFAKDQKFNYSSKTEDVYNNLIEIAKKEKYYDNAQNEFDGLHKKLFHDSDFDFKLFANQIRNLLSQEIVSRYYYQEGRIEYSLNSDPEIKKALEILYDVNLYNSVLNNLKR